MPFTDISPRCEAAIKTFEGCPPAVYHGGADRPGLLSGGFGHTGADVQAMGLGAPVSKELADTWFDRDKLFFIQGVLKEVGDAPTTQGQGDALTSLAYNIGLGHEATSTALREHIAGNYQAAADAFLLWNKANGIENGGLESRREVEAQWYIDDSPGV